MEDLTGIIIYLIIAVIGVLAGVYRNKQKKDQMASKTHAKTQPLPGVDTDYDPFSGLFEEEEEKDIISEEQEVELMAEEQTEKFTAEEEDKAGTTYMADEQELKETADYREGYIEGEAAFQKTEDVILSDSIIDEDEQVTLSEEEIPLNSEIDEYIKDVGKFDLKKAIIYSEIINRKQY